MENLRIWKSVEDVPKEAQKPIKGGRLKGYTDINPVWRLKKLTEVYGPCGFGWYYEVTSKSEREVKNGEILVFVDINLYIKEGEEWSKPIHGTGGNKLASNEKAGLYYSDEAYKMAETDAISVACKSLGFGSNVYWENGRSKYNQTTPEYDQKQMEELEIKRNDLIAYIESVGKDRTAIEKHFNKKISEMTLQQVDTVTKAVEKSVSQTK